MPSRKRVVSTPRNEKVQPTLERARLNLVRKHEDVTNRRSDWFWKLAHELTNRFDVLCFETLNLKGMQRLWGPKISDESIRGIPENPRMGGNLEREASRLYRQMVSEFFDLLELWARSERIGARGA